MKLDRTNWHHSFHKRKGGEKMKAKGISIFVTGFILIILIATPLGAQSGIKLKIGLLAPMTGMPNPDWGKKQVIGLEMALEKVNERGGIGGIPLEAVIADTGGNPQQGVAAYRKMASEDKVLVIIGPLFTNVCIDLFPVTNIEKTAVIATASANPGLSDLSKWPYAFRMTVTSDKKEAPAVKAWQSAYDIKKVVIIHEQEFATWITLANSLWPKIMSDLNIEILNKEDPISFPNGQRNFIEYAQKALAYKPDGICIAAFSEEAGNLVKEIRRQGYKQPLLGASGVANPKIIEVAGDAAEDLWSVSLFYPEDPNPKVQHYVKEFSRKCKQKYATMNCDPEQYDVVVHDILGFVADIMKKKRITGDPGRLQDEREKIRQGLTDMGVWRGTAGMMTFDKMGDGIRTTHILKIKDGRWQPVY